MRSAIAALLALVAAPALAAEPLITPRPLHVVEATGPAVMLGDGTPIRVAPGDADGAAVASYLADLSRRGGGPRLAVGAAASTAPGIRFVRRAGIAPEGYTLDIDTHGATIAASTRTGLLYGAVSLWQLLAAAPDRRFAPLHIDDAPRFAWRGLLLDSVRHKQSVATIERMIDWMALHKLNRLQWHLADDQGWRLEIKRYPRLQSIAAWRSTPPAAGLVAGRYGGFYTQAEVRHVVALAAARGITVVPEIEMPGHATAAVLAYPSIGLTTMTPANLGDWGVFPSIYGVGEPTFAFLDGVLDEVMALFPSHEIAIGGDEAVHTLWHQSPVVQAKMKALGLKDEDALQAWFVGRIGAYLNAHGRRLIGWDEILADRTLAPSDMVLSWHGADGALAAARAGHDVVMATAPTLYLDNRQSTAPSDPPGRGFVVSLADIYAYDPGNPPRTAGTPPLDAAAAAHIVGVQGQLWAEHIPADVDFEAMALPRAAAIAEIGWTAVGRRDWPGFAARLPALFARYRDLGLGADDGAMIVQADVQREGGRARATLGRQLDLGAIRFTTDGSLPTPASSAYAAPLDLPLPTRLRAASFAGGQRLARDLDLRLDLMATRRVSQQLAPCTNQVTLNLPGRAAAHGEPGPAYLVDVRDPCWVYHDADLARAGYIAVGVAALPYNYQFANEAAQHPLPPTATPAGELVIRRDRCDGPVMATVSLAGARKGGIETELTAAIPRQTTRGDLCIRLVRPTPDPLWALGWVELRP